MIQNILVALDPDEDTPVAIEHACAMAHLYGGVVTGMTVVDLKRIEKRAYGGSIGSMYYGEKLKEKWTEQTRDIAQTLISSFSDASIEANISFRYAMKEGIPSDRIISEMRYHDLLIVGNTPHFFYVHPDEETTTLVRIVKKSVAPVLVVPDKKVDLSCVLVAYDGSTPSARAMQRFCQLKPFGVDLPVHIVNVYARGEEDHSGLLLTEARDYMRSWGFDSHVAGLCGEDPHHHLLHYSEQVQAGCIVAGAHSVSKVSQLAFGSTTDSLIHNGSHLLFLER